MTHWKLVSTVAAIVALSAGVISQTQSGHAVFEQALAKERVDGNLTEAIRLYERIVAEFAADRALAAQALVQVGLCYEKLGRDEAVRAYERLVRDFADQEDAVAHARLRLAALKRPSPTAAAAATPPMRVFQKIDNADIQSLSPDGTKAALINYDKGQNLAVYDLSTQQTTLLTDFDWTPASSWVYGAVWSPDGRRIAYAQGLMRSPGRELRVVTLAGKSSVIYSGEGSMAPGGWLPDGSAIAVTLGRPDRTATIGLMPTDGTPFIPLRSIRDWVGQYPPLPSVSPDGRWLTFVEGSSSDIHVISRDGRTTHRITDHPAEDRFPVWSHDGRHMAFLSDRGGATALWTVAIKDGDPVGEPVRVKDGMQGVYPMLGWTAKGLAYSQYQQTDDVYTVPVDPASAEPKGSPRLVPYRLTGQNVEPEWSPDGKYLAFLNGDWRARPDRLSIVLLPSDGGSPREIRTPAQRIWDLRWFGDSRGFGVSGLDSKGERALFRLTLATGEWKTFPLPATVEGMQWNGMYFDWNADGTRYYYLWQDLVAADNFTIVERDVQSDRERIVFRGSAKSLDTCCSIYSAVRFNRDRRLLVFRSKRDQHGIVVLDIDTGQARVVHDTAAGETYTYTDSDPVGRPAWSPNGRALLVVRSENTGTAKQATDLRIIPVDGSEVRRIPLGAELTRLLSPGRGERPKIREDSVVWSPDGGRLAFALTSQRRETWLLDPLALTAATTAAAHR